MTQAQKLFLSSSDWKVQDRSSDADRIEGLLEVTMSWLDRSLHSAIESGYWKKASDLRNLCGHGDFQVGDHALDADHRPGSALWSYAGNDSERGDLS
jgi:hypothetical protein